MVLKGNTDHYANLDEASFASQNLWYKWPHSQTVVTEKIPSTLPCICWAPSDGSKVLSCQQDISRRSTTDVEAKLISGTLHQCLSPPTHHCPISRALLWSLVSLLLWPRVFFLHSHCALFHACQPLTGLQDPEWMSPFLWSRPWRRSWNSSFIPLGFHKSSYCVCTWIIIICVYLASFTLFQAP